MTVYRFLLTALILFFFWPYACNECKTGTCPDSLCLRLSDADVARDTGATTQPDTVGQEIDAQPDQNDSEKCLWGAVQCNPGQIDVYGICVENAEVLLEGGTFILGKKGVAGSQPEKQVEISPFYIDAVEVTNRMYQACVACGQCEPPLRDGSYTGREPYYGNPEFLDYPVVHVTWEQAQAFCQGLGKTLPTEAQWEFAARGTQGRTYPWGDEKPSWQTANTANAYADTSQVGSFPDGDTPEGISDLCGNVWEWTFDTYKPDFYSWAPSKDPVAPDPDGLVKTARGGCFASSAMNARAFVRASFVRTSHYSNVGFRCARPAQ